MENRPIIIDCDPGLDDAIYWQIPVIIGSDHPLTRERRLSNKRISLGNSF